MSQFIATLLGGKSGFPPRRQTQALLGLGVVGSIGLLIWIVLILWPAQAEEQAIYLQLTPQPAVEGPVQVPEPDSAAPPLNGLPQPSHFTPPTVGAESDQLSINTGTLDELIALPHIGEKKARKIVEQRPYRSLVEFWQKNPFSERQQLDLARKLQL